LSNKNAELIIYDLQGQVVKHLINQVLPAGNYLTKWFGDNDKGLSVSSGIYIYRLRVADRQAVGKMNLVR
jgi:flagellar hook assembly protein FlgD